MSAALFTRRSRSGWFDELDGIRGDALAQPNGEVATAMSDAPALAEIDRDTSPLALLEARLLPAATRPLAAVRAAHLRSAPTSAPAPSPPPSLVTSADRPAPPPPAGLRPLRLVAVDVPASDPSAVPEAAAPVWMPPTMPATRPAPHPVRPQEMWHPAVVAGPPPSIEMPPAAEEQIDRADLDGAGTDGEMRLSRFRFARLRPVLSGPGPRRAGDEGVVPPIDRDLLEIADQLPAGTGTWPAETSPSPPTDLRSEVEPDPEPVQVRHRLHLGDDRSVGVDGGHLRLADHADCEIHGDVDGVELELVDGWCWSTLSRAAATPVVVTMPVGRLTVPPGATALTVVEADHTIFVVVVSGEAALEHAGGRVRLGPGVMALVPLGCKPQVDVASADEVRADPLVASNLRLDADR